MIDIHNHILPAVDDGSKSWEMSVEMCRLAVADGITHMVATPHANDVYAYNREQHEVTLAELRTRTGGSIELSLGCDFHLSFDNIQDAIAHPQRYTIGTTPYLLVELSDYSVPSYVADSMMHLGSAGLRPILTHPERNPILQQDMEMALRWIRQGVVMQITANSVTGSWGERAQRAAQWLLEHRAVHVLASDAHETKRRIPKLSEARDVIAQTYGTELANMLVEGNPRAIVQGEALPYFPEPLGGLTRN